MTVQAMDDNVRPTTMHYWVILNRISQVFHPVTFTSPRRENNHRHSYSFFVWSWSWASKWPVSASRLWTSSNLFYGLCIMLYNFLPWG